jgi:hypothetical protein
MEMEMEQPVKKQRKPRAPKQQPQPQPETVPVSVPVPVLELSEIEPNVDTEPDADTSNSITITKSKSKSKAKEPKEPKAPKGTKTTKKTPAKPIAQVTPDGILGFLSTEQRPLIVHLPIHTSDINNDLFEQAPIVSQYTPATDIPVPFETTADFGSYTQIAHVLTQGQDDGHGQGNNHVEWKPEKTTDNEKTADKSEKEKTPDKSEKHHRSTLPLHYSENLMIRFQDANREQTLPASTNIACFWDCHTFTGRPVVIPTVIKEGIWYVYGNFCCPECAAAYLFNERLDIHVQWERFALLNSLYSYSIHLAPSRSVLRLFGGNLEITDYRAIIENKQIRVDVMTPPIISIIQAIDTKPIDFFDASMKNAFIPWEMDRMNRPGAQGLRLKRTKPLSESMATLDYCLKSSMVKT